MHANWKVIGGGGGGGGGLVFKEITKNFAKYVHNPAALCRDSGNIK